MYNRHDENTVLPSLLINVISRIPDVSIFIIDRTANVFFQIVEERTRG